MTTLRETAIVLNLASCLRAHGSQCGETMMQKGVYFLKDLTDVSLSYEYVLYRHGPFSFDLRDALSGMRTDEMISVTPQFQFGVAIEPTPFGLEIIERFPKTRAEHRRAFEFVAENFARKNVMELERMATALWVMNSSPDEPRKAQAIKVHQLKPHIPLDAAREAISRVEDLREAWE